MQHVSTSSPHLYRRRWRPVLSCTVALLLAPWIWLDAGQRAVWGNSLALFAGTTLIAVPISLSVALLAQRWRVGGSTIVAALLATALLIPLYAYVAGWDAAWNAWLSWRSHGGGQLPPEITSPASLGMAAAIGVHGLAAVPWSLAVAWWGLANLPGSMEDQLRLDRPPLWVIFRYTLPRLELTLWTMTLLVLLTTFNEITVTDYYQVRTFSEELYVGFATQPDLGRIVLQVLPGVLGIAAAVAALAHSWLYEPSAADVQLGERSAGQGAWSGPNDPRFSRLGSIWIWAVALLVLGWPLMALVFQAGVEQVADDSVRRMIWSPGLVVQRCATALSNNGGELLFSLGLSQLVAAGCLLTAGPLAWWARLGGPWRRAVPLTLVAAALAIPGPLLGVAIIRWLDRPGHSALNFLYDRTLFPLWLVHTIRCWPWAWLVLAAAFKSIPDSLVDQSRLDGFSSARSYVRWVVPLTFSTQAAGWFLVTGLSLNELSGSILVAPPGYTPFSVAFFSTLHYGTRYELAALCLVVWGLAWGLAGLGWWNGSYRSRPARVHGDGRPVY